MTAYRARLTEIDIRRLIQSSDEDERAAAAHKLCRNMERIDLDDEDRAAAQKILRLLANDAAELVRRAMAVTLKASDLIPNDVARKLAADVDSVALPIINFSPAFTDEDLIEIVKAGSAVRQTAVAARPNVGRDVAEAVADVACEQAVRTLASNDNADISEASLGRCVDRFGQSGEVVAALAYRQVLPLSVSERLIELASAAVREHLVTRHAVAPETAIRLASFARERATVDLIDQASAQADIPAFVANLNARKALTASLLLRALARGQMALVEHGLAELAGTPHQRAWLMIHDAGPLGLRAIYDRAGLPPRLFQAFRAGVDTWRALQAEGADTASEQFREQMLERFLTQRPHAPREDLAYLMERLDRLPAANDPAVAA
ncbi:pole-localized protein SpbR [Brevundimonas kwangchunensis]|uniref:Pole-localized protein SpbR n=1 Tax=Brevundimonas kwangchunensis TaxID=322163 RepID=A0ABP3S0V4_9CAUL